MIRKKVEGNEDKGVLRKSTNTVSRLEILLDCVGI